MKEHEDACWYRKIKCELCDETPRAGDAAIHMTNVHMGTITYNTEGKFPFLWTLDQLFDESNIRWIPTMKVFDGYAFLINTIVDAYNWSLWVVIFGDRKRAQKYEISMNIQTDAAAVSVKGEVYSIDVARRDILDGEGNGVLEFNKSMARKLSRVTSDGRKGIRVDYKLRLK